MIELQKNDTEKYLLLAVRLPGMGAYETEKSLDELAALAETAGAVEVGRLIQRLDRFDPNTYLGEGKVLEAAQILEETEATGVLCDDELSPAQMRGLSEKLGCKVIDRTILILDIFAAHAKTNEGKLQVELAQLKYRASHLSGLGTSLSRQGGGIGTRGPGETKLESDKRAIRTKIGRLAKRVKEMEQVRDVGRKQRVRNRVPVAAIVGYTNAGKSTLLGRLSGAEVFAKDMLFATLDPLTRKCRIPVPGEEGVTDYLTGPEVLLTDTVGFINKLPHQLIDAFRSTLEEAKYADLLIHVADASDPDLDKHLAVVYDTLADLGASDKPVLTVWNKTDLIPEETELHDPKAFRTVRISAKTGTGMEGLYAALAAMIRENAE
ncbi:MAG: GTPase HflX [Lachnospiraceae bacterium]|nr:GTPase HflX [Lachnospiraceae bacterium]